MADETPILDPQAEHEAILQARKLWLGRLKLDYKEEILFELEILLKGLDRFFNINNLPISKIDQVVSINFADELGIVVGFVDKITQLTRTLLDASQKSDYQFKVYVESRLLGDVARTRWREVNMFQARPEDSLFILYTNFLNFRGIIQGLAQLKQLPYSLFFNVGSMISREMVSNRFFNPIGEIGFRPEFDRVGNKLVTRVVRSIDEPSLKKFFSVVLLAFYRLLHYLDFVDHANERQEVLKSSLLFFALINSESKYLIQFMEKNVPQSLEPVDHAKAQELISLCDSLSFQLIMELKKVFQTELMDLSKHSSIEPLRAAVENSHGILHNFFQQSIVQLVMLFQPHLRGEDVFTSFVSKKLQSVKLRNDLWIFQSLMDKFEEITESTEEGASLSTYSKYLNLQKSYIAYMKRETVPLLRFSDWVEFNKYFKFIGSLNHDDLHLMDKLEKFKLESKFFKIFVETTLGNLSNRTELQDTPIDIDSLTNRLKRFIAREAGLPEY